MKDCLLKIKEEEGVESFLNKIRNCIAGCREKWKKMPKVINVVLFQPNFIFYNAGYERFVCKESQTSSCNSSRC